MSIFEHNEEEEMRKIREGEREICEKRGKVEGLKKENRKILPDPAYLFWKVTEPCLDGRKSRLWKKRSLNL